MPISSRRSLSIMWNLKLGMAKIRGKLLTHVAVVQELVKVGKLEKGKAFSQGHSGQNSDLTLPGNLRLIVFVQEPELGKVLGQRFRKSSPAGQVVTGTLTKYQDWKQRIWRLNIGPSVLMDEGLRGKAVHLAQVFEPHLFRLCSADDASCSFGEFFLGAYRFCSSFHHRVLPSFPKRHGG